MLTFAPSSVLLFGEVRHISPTELGQVFTLYFTELLVLTAFAVTSKSLELSSERTALTQREGESDKKKQSIKLGRCLCDALLVSVLFTLLLSLPKKEVNLVLSTLTIRRRIY